MLGGLVMNKTEQAGMAAVEKLLPVAKKISDFIKEKPLKNVTRPKKVKNKSKNKNFKLTKEERELQNKYDILKNKGKLPSSTYIPPTYVKSKRKRIQKNV